MPLFQWTAANDVFVPAIDDQHRAIFRVTSELQLALRDRAPAFKIHETLRRLIAGAEDHFSHEEKLMRDTRYLSLTWHKGQHDSARRRWRELAPLIDTGDLGAAKDLVD